MFKSFDPIVSCISTICERAYTNGSKRASEGRENPEKGEMRREGGKVS